MFLNTILLIGAGFCGGVGVAAGTFAFFLVIRVIPRMIQKAGLEKNIMDIENKVIQGVLFGTLFSFFMWKKKWMYWLLGKTLLTIYGLSAGIFAGCIAVALAEILDTFPIFFRRVNLKESIVEGFLFVLAFGKIAGSLFYFFGGYGMK